MPYPDMDALSQEKRDAVGYPDKTPLNITRMGLHAPEGIWRGHFAMKQAAVYDTTLEARLKEVLILRVAHLSQCAYELHHHLSISAHLGFTAQEQEALAFGRYELLSAEERAVAKFTDEVVLDVRAGDETLGEVRRLFGDALVTEILILIGSYMSTARMVRTCGVQPEAEPIRSWSATAP